MRRSTVRTTQYSHILSRLRRIYLLVNASHGLKESDTMMLSHLNQQCEAALAKNRHITLQAVFTKCDLLGANAQKRLQQMQQEIFEAAPLCLPGIVTATSNTQVGIEKVRQSIAEACGLGRVNAVIRRT